MRIIAWIDGGARGNPGPAGYGAVLTDEHGSTLSRCWGYLGRATNNVAEYRGLIAALEEARRLGGLAIDVRTDSELIQRQLTGRYKVRQPHLRELFDQARRLAREFQAFRIQHVRRERNREADALANRAIDEQSSGRDTARD